MVACSHRQLLRRFRVGELTGAAKQRVKVSQCQRGQQQLESAATGARVREASSLGGVVKEPAERDGLQSGRILSDRYTLLHELGRGGMGSVWAARDEKLRRQVAIKILSMNVLGTTTMQTRFEREAVAIAQLHSPHIVEVHDYGIDDFRPYMVMERLEGEDLATRLRKGRRLPLDFVVELTTQIAKALRAAHSAGFVHRDLKPANVFLVADPDDEVLAKVLDFGVAKVLGPVTPEKPADDDESHLTMPGMLLGTPPYMSPEQWRTAETVDHRTDLWSLAVIMFRALTGKLPFRGKDIVEFATSIRNDAAPPPSQINPSLPPAIDAFFLQALAKDPAARFQSARELASEFRAVAGGRLSVTGSDSLNDEAKTEIRAASITSERVPPVERDPLSRDSNTAPSPGPMSPGPINTLEAQNTEELATLRIADTPSSAVASGRQRRWLAPAVGLVVVLAGAALVLSSISTRPSTPTESDTQASPTRPSEAAATTAAAATASPSSTTASDTAASDTAASAAAASDTAASAVSSAASSAGQAGAATKGATPIAPPGRPPTVATPPPARPSPRRKATPTNTADQRAVDVY